MAVSFQQSLSTLESNVRALSQQKQQLAAYKEALEAENEELSSEIRKLSEENKALKADVEFLRLSHRLAQNPDDVIEGRRKLASLIRDLDRCIAQLKE